MKITKKLNLLLISFALFLTFTIAWIFRPYTKANPELIDASLKSLTQPYKNIETFFYLDGGSIGVKITGKNNQVFEACFYSTDKTIQPGKNKYNGLSIGSLHYSEEKAVFCDSIDTKLKLMEILREKSSRKLYDDACIARVSERWSDYINIFWKRYIVIPQNYMSY